MKPVSNSTEAERPLPFPPVLIALAGAATLVAAGGLAFGYTDAWAFAFLAYAPMGLRIVAGALVVLAATPLAAGWWLHDHASVEGWLRRIPLAPWMVVLASLALFWLFREQTWRGDALYKVDLLQSTPLHSNPYVWKEPLDSLFEYASSAAVRPFGLGPDLAIALMSVVAGGVFVAAGWVAAAWLGAPPQGVEGERIWRRLAIFVALLATGASQLWFGHIENYSGSTALAFVTVVLAAGVLKGRAPLWSAGLIGGAAVSFHPQAAFVLPALVVLLRRDRWLRQVATLAVSGAAIPVATVAVLWFAGAAPPSVQGGFAGDAQLFWTPAQALAPNQLADALQNLWLIAPLWPFWIVAGVWAATQPALRRDRVYGLLAVAAAGVLVYFFSFQNDLPRPRDWDLFAIAGPPLALWGVYAWLRVTDLAPSPRIVATLWQTLAVGLLFASFYAVFWIGVNHAYTLLRPNAAERERFVRYRLADLTELLPLATVTPNTPICAEPTGCARVMLTEFTMPQNGDTRPVIFAHAPAEISIPLAVPNERTFLWLSPALDPQAWDWGGDGVTFAVKVRNAAGERVLWERRMTPADPVDRAWQQAFIPLDDYRGQQVDLLLVTDPGPAGNDAGDRAGWGMPWLMRGTVEP